MQEYLSEALIIKPEEVLKDAQIYLKRPTQSTESFSLDFQQEQLLVNGSKKNISLKFGDMIGAFKERIEQGLFKLTLNSFPSRSRFCKKDRRKIQSVNIWVRTSQKLFEHLMITLLQKITNRKIKDSNHSFRLLVFLNPNAGSNSGKHWHKTINFLSYTNFTYQLVETTHRGHCREYLDTNDMSIYSGIVIISGDGLMHEFVNSKVCGVVPVTHVPGGSGNAFAKAQTTLAGQQCRDEQAMFLAVKGRISHLNLVKMELENEPQPIYSFLGFQWAFLADIDLNSQFLRCLGGLRFEIYATYRCLALRRYRGRLTYSTEEVELPPLNQPITQRPFTVLETTFLNATLSSIPFVSDHYQFAPLIKVEDKAIDMQLITEENGRWQLIKFLLNSSDGSHFDKEVGQPKEGYDFIYNKIKSFRLQPLGQGDQRGIFGIDGQRYDSQRMQACMSDKKVLTFY